jgi:hypothetical protein
MPEFTDTLADTACQGANNTHLDKLLSASLPPANLLAGQHTKVASHAHCIDMARRCGLSVRSLLGVPKPHPTTPHHT